MAGSVIERVVKDVSFDFQHPDRHHTVTDIGSLSNNTVINRLEREYPGYIFTCTRQTFNGHGKWADIRRYRCNLVPVQQVLQAGSQVASTVTGAVKAIRKAGKKKGQKKKKK